MSKSQAEYKGIDLTVKKLEVWNGVLQCASRKVRQFATR